MSTPDELVAALAARGDLDLSSNSEIGDAFLHVARERFTPDAYWVEGPGGVYVPRAKGDDPALWAEPVYRNELIVTQVDGGAEPLPGAVGHVSTCSLSAPGIVALMLRQAAIKPGDRVLEVGTGQGFNSALCAHLSGGGVVSVEIDAALADVARGNLMGDSVSVLVADGKLGAARRGPFDVILSTVAFDRVPSAWLGQLAPGGRIVLPLHKPFYRWGVLTLGVKADGGAEGEFLHDGNFMADRSVARPDHPPFSGVGKTTVTGLSPEMILGSGDAQFALAHALPGVRQWKGLYENEPEKARWYSLWVWDGAGSWAAADYQPGARVFEVEQYGPRSLWVEIEAAYRGWVELGMPRVEDWRYVVDRGVQRLVPKPGA